MSAFERSFGQDSVKTLTLFQNDVAKQLFRKSLGVNLKRNDGDYMDGTVMPISRLNALVALW